MPARFALFALFLAATPCKAQKWTGAIKIGTAYTTLSGNLIAGQTDWEPLTGLAAGSAIGFDFANGLILQLDITYVRKGAAAQIMFQGMPARIQSDLTYLELPLLVHGMFKSGSRFHPRLFAGPALAFQLESHLTHSAATGGGSITEKDESIHLLDVGAVVGAAIEIVSVGQRFFLEARYYHGFTDITEPHPVLGDSEIAHRSLVVLTGVVF